MLQELLVFHRSVEDGRLDHLDSAIADGVVHRLSSCHQAPPNKQGSARSSCIPDMLPRFLAHFSLEVGLLLVASLRTGPVQQRDMGITNFSWKGVRLWRCQGRDALLELTPGVGGQDALDGCRRHVCILSDL